jgi:hypothetical protein
MGYGTGPFGGAPLGVPLPPQPEEVVSDLSSSRKIDGVTGRYVPNEQGGFEAMDDTAQRVLLLVSFADTDSKIISPQGMSEQEAKIRKALEPLTAGRNPDIDQLVVTVKRTASQTTEKSISYRNRLTMTRQTVGPI